MPSQHPETPVICGPTACGKSDLALQLARSLAANGTPAEIVSADAFQVYRGLDIASAKPTTDQRRAIPHHLIDIAEPEHAFTVAEWLARARDAISDIHGRGAVPLVVGGTHLYIKALLDGMFDAPPPDPDVRARLEAMPHHERRAELRRVDPVAAERIHPNDHRRTVRALEVHRQTGTPISTLQQQWDNAPPDHTRLFILRRPTPDLNARINARVRRMLADGLLGETRHLAPRLGPTAGQALGTKQILRHIHGLCSLDEATEQIKIETRRFAKKQRTWMRRLSATPGAITIDLNLSEPDQIVQTIVNKMFMV